MPFYLKEKENFHELAGCKSVLIVPCRFCPAASMAVSRNEPYIELLSRFLKTDSYEKLIKTIKANLEKQGIMTDVFRSNLLHQFVLCSWSSKKRTTLKEVAGQYEALLVLGCEAAVRTIQDAIQPTSCQVVQGMETEGLMSIKPRFHLPCNVSLELDSVTPVQKRNETASDPQRANILSSACKSEQAEDRLQQMLH